MLTKKRVRTMQQTANSASCLHVEVCLLRWTPWLLRHQLNWNVNPMKARPTNLLFLSFIMRRVIMGTCRNLLTVLLSRISWIYNLSVEEDAVSSKKKIYVFFFTPIRLCTILLWKSYTRMKLDTRASKIKVDSPPIYFMCPWRRGSIHARTAKASKWNVGFSP